MEKNGGAMSVNFKNLPVFLAEIGEFFVSLWKKEKKDNDRSKEKIYDAENSRPVLKCSICNGEQVAGFKDIHTGKFEEIMLIRDQKDLELFMSQYGICEITKEY